MVIEKIAVRHGVDTDELIDEAQAWIDMVWASEDPLASPIVKMFPEGKPTVEEFIVVMAIQVLSLEHNNSKENMKIDEFSEFDEFPDEIDKF